MNKDDLIIWCRHQRDKEKNVSVRTAFINILRHLESMEYPQPEAPVENKNPKQIIADCTDKLKVLKSQLTIGDLNFLIINRVIRDIEFTATKITF